MKYLLTIAVFLAGAIFPFALKGQSVRFSSQVPTLAAWSRPGPSRGGDFGFHPFLHRSRDVVFPPFWGYPSNYPFEYFYPGLWPPIDAEYQQASQIAHGDVAAEIAAQEKSYLTSQIQALTDEVQSLRQERTSHQYTPVPAAQTQVEAPPQPSPQVQSGSQQKFPATVFIYRDGRSLEVRDYAVFGDTLWVFMGETSRKFPLTDFNLAASRQVNEEHGVEFPLPDHR